MPKRLRGPALLLRTDVLNQERTKSQGLNCEWLLRPTKDTNRKQVPLAQCPVHTQIYLVTAVGHQMFWLAMNEKAVQLRLLKIK